MKGKRHRQELIMGLLKAHEPGARDHALPLHIK